MAFIPALNTVRVTFEYTLNGRIVVNVFYLTKTGPVVSIDLTNLAAQLKSWYTTYVKPHVNAGLSLNRIILRDMTVLNGVYLESLVNPPITGVGLGAPLPSSVAQVITLQSGLSGRSRRGRVYMAGLGEDQVDGNDVNSVTTLGLAVAWANINSFISPTSCSLSIASFYSGGLPRATALLTPVISQLARSRVDTQRRRLSD